MRFNVTFKKIKFNSNSEVVLRGKPTEVIQTTISKQVIHPHFLWSSKRTSSLPVCGNERTHAHQQREIETATPL